MAEPIGYRYRSRQAVQAAARDEPNVEPVWLWTTAYGEAAVLQARRMLRSRNFKHLDIELLYNQPPEQGK